MVAQKTELQILLSAVTDPSVGRMVQQVVVNLKTIEQRTKETNTTIGTAGSGISDFFKNVLSTTLGVQLRDIIAGGLKAVRDGVVSLTEAMIGANASFELYTTTITAMTGSTETAGNMLAAIRQIARETGRGFTEMVEIGQPLVRFAQGSSKALYELMRAMMLLQAIKPHAGPVSAMIAITEALSGQFRSLQYRFEIGKKQIDAVLEAGYTGVEALLEILKRQGASWELVTAQADTFRGILTTLGGLAQDFFRAMGEPVFTQIVTDLRVLRDWLVENEDAIMGLARAIGSYLAVAYDTIIALLTDWLGLAEGGLQSLSIDAIVQWGANLIAALVDGILAAADQILLPALVAIADLIASVLAGPRTAASTEQVMEQAVEKVGETVERTGKKVQETVQETREAEEEAAKEHLTEKEAEKRGAELIEAAEKKVAAAKEAVRKATEQVRKAQERLNVFLRNTAEIPERFTRARKRQLEAELDAARKEEQKKRDALQLVQETVRAAQEQAKALKELAEEQSAFAVGASGDVEQMGSRVEEFTQRFRDMIAQAFAERDIGERWESIQKQFETLGGSVEIITGNIWKIPDAIGRAAGFAGDMVDAFNDLPPWAQNILKGIAIVVGINLVTGGMVSAILTALAPLGITLATGPAAGVALLAISIAVLFKIVESNKQELWTTIQQLFGIGAFGAVSLIPEGPTKEYLKDTFVNPMLETMEEANPFIEKQAKKTFYDPVSGQVRELADDIVTNSVIPDMIDAILDEYERLENDVLPVVESFTEDVTDQFENLAAFVLVSMGETTESTLRYTDEMSTGFSQLSERVRSLRSEIELLTQAINRIPAMPNLPAVEDITRPLRSGFQTTPAIGTTKRTGAAPVFQVSFPNMMIGANVTEEDWMAWAREVWEKDMRQFTRRLVKGSR